jgi:hypothetical protein
MRSRGLFLIMSLLISCIDHQDIVNDIKILVWTDPLKGLPDEGPVQFDNPVIGQRSYYVFFRAFQEAPANNVRYEYITDTLAVGISGKNATHWILKEFFTAGSYSFQTAEGGFNTDSVYVTLMQIKGDSINFIRPSPELYSTYFFYFEIVDRLAFPLSKASDPAPQNPTCSPFFDHSFSGMEYALDYAQLGQTFDHLNIHADYSRIESDGPGLMYVYGSSHGFVRRTGFNPWTGEAAGWDLIPR